MSDRLRRIAPPSDRQTAIEFALKAAALKLLSHQISILQALAAVTSAMCPQDEKATQATPREFAAAGRQAHRAAVIAELVRLEQEKGRAAAMILARLNAADPLDPVEVETLANKYRRWRRAAKNTGNRPFAGLPLM